MASRSTPKTGTSQSHRDVAIELAKAALASGILQRVPASGESEAQQGRRDAMYIDQLVSHLEYRLRLRDEQKAAA